MNRRSCTRVGENGSPAHAHDYEVAPLSSKACPFEVWITSSSVDRFSETEARAVSIDYSRSKRTGWCPLAGRNRGTAVGDKSAALHHAARGYARSPPLDSLCSQIGIDFFGSLLFQLVVLHFHVLLRVGRTAGVVIHLVAPDCEENAGEFPRNCNRADSAASTF